MSTPTALWRLKKNADRRIRGGHPWIFSNELQESPKGLVPGSAVELRDCQGQFLARGYGNPHSLIAFRALSFAPAETQPWSESFLCDRLVAAWRLRIHSGFRGSFRLCFAENDFLPGLVVDYYRVRKDTSDGQVFVIQISTAGMDHLLRDVLGFVEALCARAEREGLSSLSWADTAVVLRNDVSIRKLEGLDAAEPQVLKEIAGVNLSQAEIAVNQAISKSNADILWMSCDLFRGQKTGFFLDQMQNIRLVCGLISGWEPRTVRILDLCCYVGHWSTQLAKALIDAGHQVEVTEVDVSESALAFAAANLRRIGVNAKVAQLDVLTGLDALPKQSYDIVIADPPAFIKAKKDIPTGKHAYLKLNAQAFRLVAPQGIVASCSCSGLLTEDDLRDAVRRAIQRNQTLARCILKGGHSPDHPTLVQFPEGFYLKMLVHGVE